MLRWSERLRETEEDPTGGLIVLLRDRHGYAADDHEPGEAYEREDKCAFGFHDYLVTEQ